MIKKSDAQIQQEVRQELKGDTRVEETVVEVTVDHGVVTLTGAVSSYTTRWAAEEAAHRVCGVLDVANDIQVNVPRSRSRSDTEIAQAVRRALEWENWVPNERIQSTVSNGWVTLKGEVDRWRERENAERAVRYLPGVWGVTNEIVIHGPKVTAHAHSRKI